MWSLPYSVLQLVGVTVDFDLTGHHTDFLDFNWHSKFHHIHMKLALWSIVGSSVQQAYQNLNGPKILRCPKNLLSCVYCNMCFWKDFLRVQSIHN